MNFIESLLNVFSTESVIEKAISTALQDAKNKGIHGKNVTPFILAAVAEATGGASLAASILLIVKKKYSRIENLVLFF